MLPVPCKLLGEIHVRVLRVLFAAGAEEASLVASSSSASGAGKNPMAGYFYGKFGDGDGVDLIKRRKRAVVTKSTDAGSRHCDADDENKQTNNDNTTNEDSGSGGITGWPSAVKVLEYTDDEEFVPKKGGNNLTFLDQSTWPLFFQDYALITEGKLFDAFDSDYNDMTASVNANDANGGIATGCGGRGFDYDNDEFIDMRSVAMLPSEDINLHPKSLPDFANDNFNDEDEEEDSPQRGSANYANPTESASRCPAGPFGKRNHLGRFVCCPFHILAAVQMYRNLLSPACTSVALSSGSTNSMIPTTTTFTANSVLKNNGAKPRRPVKKARKARRRSSLIVNKGGDDDIENDDDDFDAEYDDDDYNPPAKYDNHTSRVARSIDMTKLPTKHPPMFPSSSPSDCDQPASWKSLPGGVDGRVPHSQVIMTPGQAPTSKAIAVSRSPLSIIHQPLGPPPSRQIEASTRSFRHIVVPEVQLPPPAESTLVVSRKIEKNLEFFFSNGPNCIDHVVSDMDPTEDNVSKSLFQRPGELYSERLLAHMIPVQNLERGIPYHHLCLNDKLTILEFLLDELLQVTEISSEMTRRHGHTLQYSYLYGAIPSPRDYEQMENADECRICGIEGQLLCCDGCPGSFHRTCIGMSAYAKLPEGKWLCPECKIVDSSKMVS